MKIHVANYQPDKLGGGWSFARNFTMAFGDDITTYDDADIYFICSPSMVQLSEVEQAKKDGKKIILRVDNILRNSRNRNTGMTRMKAMAELADEIVYQSGYAQEILGEQYIKKEGTVILNSCNTDIFHDRGRRESTTAKFLYSRVNRDETKNWEMARFIYQQEARIRENDATLNILGQYSPELIDYNFDFYNGENYRYWGTVSDVDALASIYRDSDYLIYTFFNDACSNTLIEALCCGCQIIDTCGMLETGGAPEIMHMFEDHGGAEYFSLKRIKEDYMKVMA